ncbi:hypothetical protein BJ875DRAFT_479910 [Amylocarpus encephaloides]|uniref:Uncharacterized protein n=1 Tax=Amylocarpus encephaloides TaxID=45428 RepID=A0A9P7YSC6_9HELO|nr:hypothetical protein BJ875DRAFT_479910 [Amylocarpus encephaloides]
MPPVEGLAISPQQEIRPHQFHNSGPPPAANYQNVIYQGGSPPLGRVQKTPSVPFLDRLRQLPEIRAIPWREGQELPREKAIDSPRVQQRGAILLSTRGNAVAAPCSHCAGGFGRFSQCVTLDAWFQGACSTCIFTSKGNKCSLRCQTSGDADGRALRYHSSNPEMLQSFLMSKKKRKRPSASSTTQVLLESPSLDVRHPIDIHPPMSLDSLDLDMLLQEEIAKANFSTEHIQGNVGEKKKRRQPMIREPDFSVAPSEQQAMKWGSATVPPNPRLEAGNFIGKYYQPPAKSESAAYTPQANPPQTPPAPAPAPNVLPNTPRPKLYNVLGIICGLQGNIEALQKQLNNLKTTFGIDL